MLEIPLIQVPNQELLVTLNEQDCTLHIYQRRERVYLDLAMDGVTLRRGAVCLPCVDVVAQPYPFRGHLYWTDELSKPEKQQPPQYTGFGTRYHLYYLTHEEQEEILTEAGLNIL